MADLKNPKIIFFKGFLFLLIGIVSATLLLIEFPDLRVAVLLALAVVGGALVDVGARGSVAAVAGVARAQESAR